MCHLGHGDHRLKLWKINGTMWENAILLLVTLLWRCVFFCCIIHFKGKEIEVVVVVFRGHIGRNDETP